MVFMGSRLGFARRIPSGLQDVEATESKTAIIAGEQHNLSVLELVMSVWGYLVDNCRADTDVEPARQTVRLRRTLEWNGKVHLSVPSQCML